MKSCKVKTCKLDRTDKLILKELRDNREGLRVTILAKVTKIKGRTLYYHLNKLKRIEFIENDYPIWRLCKNQRESQKFTNLLLDEEIQLHNLL